MKRLTSKEVSKMMEEVNQLAELTNPVMPSAVRDQARKKLKAQGKTDAEIDKLFADMDAAAQARLNPTPEQRKAQVERDRLIQKAGGGVAGEKAATERLKSDPLRFLYDIESRGKADVRTKGREALKQLGDGDIERGLEIFRSEQEKRIKPEPETKPSSSPPSSVPAGSFNISPKGSDRRNEVEAQIKRDNAARTDDQRVKPRTAPKPQLTDQQKVRAEYDRLRYSKDPKERAQAASYGKAMAAAGAAKKNFSGYKSAAELSKPAGNIVKSGSGATLSNAPKNDLAKGSTPIVVNRGTTEKTSYAYNKPVMGSMAQRLQAIRARQGRPQTPPAVQPKTQPAAATPVTSQSAASRALNTGSLKDKQDAMDIVNKRYASSIDQLVTDMMIKNIKKPGNNTVKPTSNTQTKPKPAVTSKPVVNPNQKSSIQQKVDNVKKPVQTGDKPVVKVNPDTSEMELKQKRSPEATKKIKKSLDI